MGDARFNTPDSIWIAGGTGNVTKCDEFKVVANNVPQVSALGLADGEQHIYNKSQMIFAFEMPDVKNGEMTTRDRWTELDADPFGGMDPKIADGDEGWYIPLQIATSSYHDEYTTTRPVLFQGMLFVATFREAKISLSDPGACESTNINGTTRLYALLLDSGQSVLWGDAGRKYLEFDGIKITGFTLSKSGDTPVLLVSYQELDKAAAEQDITTNTGNEESLSKVDGMNALAIMLPTGSGFRTNVTSNDGVVNYWRFIQ
jgi:hypothetical protein